MSIRIYALAKKLKVESKLLVDVCKKLGLDGKGSALASLTEEEVKLVSDSMKASPATVKSVKELTEEAAARPLQKPTVSLHTSKIPVLKPSRPSRLSELIRSTDKKASSESEPEVDNALTLPEDNAEPTLKTVVETQEQDQTGREDEQVPESDSSPIETASSFSQTPSSDQATTPQKTERPLTSDEGTGATKTDSTPVFVQKDEPDVEPVDRVATSEESAKKPQENESSKLSQSAKTGQEGGIASSVSSAEKIPSRATAPISDTDLASPLKSASSPSFSKESRREKSFSGTAEGEKRDNPKSHVKSSLNVFASKKGGTTSDEEPVASVPKPELPSAPKEPLSPPSLSMKEMSRQEALAEMKRPPVITPPNADRMFVFDQKKKKRPENENTGRPLQRPTSSQKSGLAIHLAPLPTAPQKPLKKKTTQEPAPQKPSKRFSPDEIRAEMEKTKRPLTEHIKEGREKKRGKIERPERSDFVGETSRDAGHDDKDRVRKDKDRDRRKVGTFPEPIPMPVPETFGAGKGKKAKVRATGDVVDEPLRPSKPQKKDRDTNFKDFRQYKGDFFEGGSDTHFVRQTRQKKSKNVISTVPRKTDLSIELPCTVKQFAEATGISVQSIIKKLIEVGMLMTINQNLDYDTVDLLVAEFDLKATIRKEKSLEEQFVSSVFDMEDSPESLKPRPPVVTFLGHVDHGKTSLLDRILHLNVVSGEKGGITQHIRAYRVTTPSGVVTFVDTPGHEAFTEMRARGANCTDIAVLVVAADDGVMPQTEEAISHAKAAGVPIVVALNKMDLTGVNRDRVVQELAANDIMPSEWGGDVEIVETSAVTGKGIDDLMNTLLTIAELNELKANPDRPAMGVALESSLEQGQGVVCKILVQKGTLRPGDVVLCGNAYGRVRSMFDTLDSNRHILEAGPSTPVTLIGLNVAPSAGSKFVVLDNISTARQIAEERTKLVHENELSDVQSHVTLEGLFERINTAKTQQILNIIIRADVRGSIEAIRKELGKLEHPEVKVKILQATVGGITEADVHLADASDAIIVGFSVVPDEGARTLAEKKKVQIRRYDIIYKLTEDIKAALEGMLKPIEQVKELGRAIVQKTFSISRVGVIAGCRVLSGTVERDSHVRVIRDSRIIGDYALETLKREKDDAKEVREGYECGIKLKNYNDVKEGDILESYKIEEIARTF